MRKTRHTKALPLAITLALVGLAVGASSTPPPDSEYNDALKRIEIVDSVLVGESLEVRHTIDSGSAGPGESSVISNHPADDTDARLEVDVDGNSWVVWTRRTETSQVILRKRNAWGGWTSDVHVSEPDEHSYAPMSLHDGNSIWVTYSIDDGESFGVAVRSGDGPVPWPVRSVIHTIYSRAAEPEPRLHMIEGQLLVTWNESRFTLGYSVFDETLREWGTVHFEDHDGDRSEALEKLSTGLLD